MKGERVVYVGHAKNNKFQVWHGWRSGTSSSFEGRRENRFARLGPALRRAHQLEAKGFDTKITEKEDD